MKTDDPRDRMGVYKRLEDVPDERRFRRFASSYEGRDVWAEFSQPHDIHRAQNWDSYSTKLERAGGRWKDHMEERGRHHALATPDDIVTFTEGLLDELAIATVYKHWVQVEKLYKWLLYHADHPHVYQPVWMAVIEDADGATGRLWNHNRGGFQ